MVNRGDIRDNQSHYTPALLALADITDEPDVRQLFLDCTKVLQSLRASYLENQTELTEVHEFAAQAELPLDRFHRALAYLIENVSPIAGSQAGPDGAPGRIVPAEKVLLLEDVDAVLDELRTYRQLRASWSGLPLEEVAVSSSEPANAAIAQRAWLHHVPRDVQALLAETYAARDTGLRALVLMGVRAAIDMSCNHLVGDSGTFDSKLAALHSSGRISETQRDTLQALIQLGHASAHRGHQPSMADVDDALDILERLLKAQYADPHTAKRFRDSTPARAAVGKRSKPDKS